MLGLLVAIGLLLSFQGAVRADTPGWREPGRCGANALFVLYKLLGADIKYVELDKLLPYHAATGSSAAELVDAAAERGLALEVRQVAPGQLSSLDPPYILHLDMTGKGGEQDFVTVYANDGETMRYIDGTSGLDMYGSEKILSPHLTGFVILRAGQSAPRWSHWRWLALGATICTVYQAWLVRRARSGA